MKVLIRNKRGNRKAFIEMRRIDLQENSSNDYSLYATDMEGKRIILHHLSAERANEIEIKICQDYVIDLTEDYDSYRKVKEPKTPTEIIDAFAEEVDSLFKDGPNKSL